MLEVGIAYMLGIIVGCIIAQIFKRSKHVGIIYFYDQDPGENPAMVAELIKQPSDILKLKYATFKISHK